MPSNKPDWKTNENIAVGKGATVQEFLATVGDDKLQIDVAPWGEGHLRVNGREIAHINNEKDRRQAFRKLKTIADRYLEEHPPKSKGKSSMIPVVKAKLLEGKRGLIVGIANENSIAWGCAKAFRAFGAELAVTYSQRQSKEICRTARARVGSADHHAARRAHPRPDGGGIRTDHQGMGQTRFRRPLDRVFSQGSAAGACGRRVA